MNAKTRRIYGQKHGLAIIAKGQAPVQPPRYRGAASDSVRLLKRNTGTCMGVQRNVNVGGASRHHAGEPQR
jgi:hypothetical protein